MHKRANASFVLITVLLVAAVGVWAVISNGAVTGNAVVNRLSSPPPQSYYSTPSTVTATTVTVTTSSTYPPQDTVTTTTTTTSSTVTTTTRTSTTTTTTPACTNNVQCDDGNDCTKDACSAGKCAHPVLHCTPCSFGFCDHGQCVNVAAMPVDCNENYRSDGSSSTGGSYLPPPKTPCERIQRILAVSGFFTRNCQVRYNPQTGPQFLLSVQLGNQGP